MNVKDKMYLPLIIFAGIWRDNNYFLLLAVASKFLRKPKMRSLDGMKNDKLDKGMF